MGHLPTVVASAGVTISLLGFGVLAVAAALLLVVGAARRRARTLTAAPLMLTAAPRSDEESTTMSSDRHDAPPADTSSASTAPASSNGRATGGRSRRRATAPTTTPEPTPRPTPAGTTASVPAGTRVRAETPVGTPADGPAIDTTAPARKGRARTTKAAPDAATTAQKAPAEKAKATRSRTRAAATTPVTPEPAPAAPVVPVPPTVPAGGRFLAARRGRAKALLGALDVPGAVVRRRDDVAAVLTRFYADAVRAHDVVHVVQLTDESRADLGVELHAAGQIVGDPRAYRDLASDGTDGATEPGLHGLRRPRVDGVAVKALRGASSAVLVVDTRRTRTGQVAEAAAMLDGLGVAVRGVVVWKGRIPHV